MDVRDQFLAHVSKTPNGCWIWQASKLGPYGQFRKKSLGNGGLAHRASYILFVGPIPDGLQIQHSCDEPLCVNPDHLSPGTPLRNMMDQLIRGRRHDQSGDKNPFAKLTRERVERIRTLAKAGTSHRELMIMFGVSRTTIWNVVNGRSWPNC